MSCIEIIILTEVCKYASRNVGLELTNSSFRFIRCQFLEFIGRCMFFTFNLTEYQEKLAVNDNLWSSLLMAKTRDSAFDNFDNDSTNSEDECSDDFSPIEIRNFGNKKRHRKRSASLPFIEGSNGGLWKGLVAAKSKETQSVKSKVGNSRGARMGNEWKSDLHTDETMELSNQRLQDGNRPTRRSSSMPEFYSRSDSGKKVSHRRTVGSGPKTRNKTDETVARNLELSDDESKTLILPIISGGESFKWANDQNGNQVESSSRRSPESTTLQRKTYLPHINSKNGTFFVKSRYSEKWSKYNILPCM